MANFDTLRANDRLRGIMVYAFCVWRQLARWKFSDNIVETAG